MQPHRRQLLAASGVAALGATGLEIHTATAQDPKPAEPKNDHECVVAAGMTEDEAECWDLIAKAAGKFFSLPEMHPMDKQEVSVAIHVVQNKLLGRPTYRKYKELAMKLHKEKAPSK